MLRGDFLYVLIRIEYEDHLATIARGPERAPDRGLQIGLGGQKTLPLSGAPSCSREREGAGPALAMSATVAWPGAGDDWEIRFPLFRPVLQNHLDLLDHVLRQRDARCPGVVLNLRHPGGAGNNAADPGAAE